MPMVESGSTFTVADRSEMSGVALMEMRSMLVTVKIDRRGRQHGVSVERIGEMMNKHLASVRTEFDRHGTPRVIFVFEGVDLRFEQVEVWSPK